MVDWDKDRAMILDRLDEARRIDKKIDSELDGLKSSMNELRVEVNSLKKSMSIYITFGAALAVFISKLLLKWELI